MAEVLRVGTSGGTCTMSESSKLSRRDALAVGIGAAVVASGIAKDAETKEKTMRMPVVYLPHGGGPWPFAEMGMDKAELAVLAGYLKALKGLPKTPPKALLVVSAHWEEATPTLMTAPHPPMFYDYYGFPPETYKITWPAPGDPLLAARVQKLLEHAGFASATDSQRGFDHGTFVPLKLTYPDAQIPTVQLSLKRGLDPAEHVAIGRALASLRDEGVFIIGSGMSYHNMRGFGNPTAGPASEAFDGWLRETIALEPAARDARLAAWTHAPAARLVHPREEHLLPLMVIAGAAGADRGVTAYNHKLMGVQISAFHFG
jgi:aromatic ring-opening dioxygenase catalytic subunit (LigB family)